MGLHLVPGSARQLLKPDVQRRISTFRKASLKIFSAIQVGDPDATVSIAFDRFDKDFNEVWRFLTKLLANSSDRITLESKV